jgi:hypothetical protein
LFDLDVLLGSANLKFVAFPGARGQARARPLVLFLDNAAGFALFGKPVFPTGGC